MTGGAMTDPWLLLLGGWAAAAALMAIFWLAQLRTGDAGIVDVVWSVAVGLLAILFAWLADGHPSRRILLGVLVGIWSLRLGGHLLTRVMQLPEDGRYQRLRAEWGDRAQRNLFLYFQVQAVWGVLFAIPLLVAARNPRPLGALDAAGVAIWLVALVGESLADRQLGRFRRDPANRGRVCRDGLWRYSRHPNYFFEWVHWWAYPLLAWSAPAGWVALLGPLVMLYFLLKVTGVPPTEANALASRGDAYREYQRTTSVFFPWPPKKGAP